MGALAGIVVKLAMGFSRKEEMDGDYELWHATVT